MAIKPTKPDWIPDDTSGIVVPGTSKQTAGWFKEERPPYQFFNWFFNIVSQFIDYFSGEAEFNVIIDSDTDEGDYTTLAAYIADSPAAGDRVFLKVDEEITGATMIIPANILLKQQKGKKLWCDENLATVLQFSDGVVTEGDLLLELSHTGTVANAVSFNGDDNNHCNIIVDNTSTGTITNAFKIEATKKGNLANGEAINSGAGSITNALVDSSAVTSNKVLIRESGGVLHGADGTADARLDVEHKESGAHGAITADSIALDGNEALKIDIFEGSLDSDSLTTVVTGITTIKGVLGSVKRPADALFYMYDFVALSVINDSFRLRFDAFGDVEFSSVGSNLFGVDYKLIVFYT